tara:strand:+ start:403 stop:642 length:240 start_codon:yes stop_codon:yes gene_type:complete
MITGQCPSSHFSIKTGFETHYDCVLNGYAVAQQTYMELKKLENVNADHIEKNKLVIKFECREIKLPDIIVPPRKPKLPA